MCHLDTQNSLEPLQILGCGNIFLKWVKFAFFCGSNSVTKKGFSHGHQRWFCKACGRHFSHPRVDFSNEILRLRFSGKLSSQDIANQLGVSRSTVCRKIRSAPVPEIKALPGKIIALTDTTYWGWNFGVVAIKDAIKGRIVWSKFINRKERVEDYVEGVEWLENNGFEIKCIVSDGLRGLRERLSRYPFQYCQFHQVKTVRHWLTSRPKLDASRELLDLTYFMVHTDRASFEGLFGEWECKWKAFLKERTLHADGKMHYTHKNLRSAYHSIKRNMRFLWTFEELYGLGIPNTNNGIESVFTDLKSILRLHKGISMNTRKTMILEYFSRLNADE